MANHSSILAPKPHEHKQYEKQKNLSTNLTNIYKIYMRKTTKLMSESKGLNTTDPWAMQELVHV